jgi:hypothetical protein
MAYGVTQGCQMVYFQTKKANLGKFWRALECNMLIYFMPILNIHIMAVWYILWSFGKFVVIS